MSKESAEVLKKFLIDNHVTKTEFCKFAEISRFSLYKYLAGANIHPKTAKRIEKNILTYYRVFIPHEKLI